MSIHRRGFIKVVLGAGALALTSGGILAACGSGPVRPALGGSIPPADLPGLEKGQVEILRYASMAPSGHNTQPWFVRPVGPGEWIVGADSARRLPAVDPENIELMMSLGAFTENLCLAAGALGWKTEVEVIARTTMDEDVLRVRLERGEPTGYPLELLEKRMTPKRGYQPRELPAPVVQALAERAGGLFHYFPRGSSHARCIAEAAVECFRLQAMRDDAQAELVGWLRFKDSAVKEYGDGLTPAGMGLKGLAGFFVRHFAKPEDFLKPANRRRGIDTTAELAAEGGGWIVLAGRDDSVVDIIETGRRFERISLLAREHNIGLHPMTQVLEEAEGKRLFAANHQTGIIPRLVLRVGYLEPFPKPVSPRRRPAMFLRS